MENSKKQKKSNKLNLPDNTVSALAYGLTFISGLIIFLIETDNKKIRFHALQSIVFGLIWTVFPTLLAFTIILAPLALLFNLAMLIVWIFMIVKAYKGQSFRLPIIADWVDKQLK